MAPYNLCSESRRSEPGVSLLLNKKSNNQPKLAQNYSQPKLAQKLQSNQILAQNYSQTKLAQNYSQTKY